MTLQLRSLRQRGTFDEERATPYRCLCGRSVTGRCKAVLPSQCRYWVAPVRVPGRFGAVWAQEGDEHE